MRIGLDISQSVYEGTGSARYTNGLLQAILNSKPEDEWTFLFSSLRRSLNSQLETRILQSNFQLRKYKLPPTFFHYAWNVFHKIPVESFVGHQDWFITSDWTQPPAHCRIATLIHDVIFLKHPEIVLNNLIQAQSQRLRWAKEESSLFFALSEATKQDLHTSLGVPKEKIIVNYPGVEVFSPSKEKLLETRKRYHITKPFILTVGKIEPRKNLKRLIEAFSALKTDRIELLIAGPAGWDSVNQSQHPHVRFLGYVSDADLFGLYQSCLFFVYATLYEGFGFPAVEAMKLGCPVTMSNTSSLKEIGQGCALFFDPYEVSSITKALQQMIEDENLKKKFVEKGQEKSREFTWEKNYQTIINSLKRS